MVEIWEVEDQGMSPVVDVCVQRVSLGTSSLVSDGEVAGTSKYKLPVCDTFLADCAYKIISIKL